MRKIAIISAAGLGLAVIVAALALAQENALAPAQQVVDTQKARDEAFAAHRDAALAAIDKHELAKADAACHQLLSECGDHPDLAQGLYDIARKHGDVGNTDKAKQLYGQVMQRWHESEWAIHAQRDLIHAAIKRRDDQATQGELDKLLTGFARHKDIAGTVYNLAKHYDSLNNAEMARRLHDYNVEHYADDVDGMYSQVEIVKSHLASGDDAAVDAACNKLVNTFSRQKGLPKEVYQIGTAYSKARRVDRAGAFYRYVLDHWPQSPHAAWAELAILDDQGHAESDPAVQTALGKLLESLSQQDLSARELYRAARDLARSKPKRALALHRHNGRDSAQDDQYGLWSATELTKAYIRDGNEPAAEQAVNEMTARFAEQETLSTELARVGDTFAQAGRYDQADQLYQYIRQHWSKAEDTLWARAGQVRLHISKGEDDKAEASLQQLMADYARDASLPQAVEAVAEAYHTRANVVEGECICQFSHPGEYAHILMVQGRPEAVKSYFRRAIKTWEIIMTQLAETPEVTAAAYVFAGECCEKIGDYGKAYEYFYTAVGRYPDYQHAPYAQFMILKIINGIQREGHLTIDEAAAMKLQAAQTLRDRYPQSEYAPLAARTVEHLIERELRKKELEHVRN
jgi:outer membrane protein assembly factor BamD (BamD/ComL family)